MTKVSVPIEDRDAPVIKKVEKKPVGKVDLGFGNLKWDYPKSDLLKNHKK